MSGAPRWRPIVGTNILQSGIGAVSTAAIALLGTSFTEANTLRVTNTGANPVWFRIGSSNAMDPATTADDVIGPGASLAYALSPSDTHFRAISTAGATDINVIKGYFD